MRLLGVVLLMPMKARSSPPSPFPTLTSFRPAIPMDLVAGVGATYAERPQEIRRRGRREGIPSPSRGYIWVSARPRWRLVGKEKHVVNKRCRVARRRQSPLGLLWFVVSKVISSLAGGVDADLMLGDQERSQGPRRCRGQKTGRRSPLRRRLLVPVSGRALLMATARRSGD